MTFASVSCLNRNEFACGPGILVEDDAAPDRPPKEAAGPPDRNRLAALPADPASAPW